MKGICFGPRHGSSRPSPVAPKGVRSLDGNGTHKVSIPLPGVRCQAECCTRRHPWRAGCGVRAGDDGRKQTSSAESSQAPGKDRNRLWRLFGGGLRRVMGADRPEPDLGQDLLYDRGMINEGDDTHWVATAVGLVHLFDQPSPLSLECPRRLHILPVAVRPGLPRSLPPCGSCPPGARFASRILFNIDILIIRV